MTPSLSPPTTQDIKNQTKNIFLLIRMGRNRYECINCCFIVCLCIGFFMLAGGISLTAVGGTAGRNKNSITYTEPNDPIGSYNTMTSGYSETQVDALNPPGAIISASPVGGSSSSSFSFNNFGKQARSVSLIGEVSRITTPNPTTSYMLMSTRNYPSSVVANPDDYTASTLSFSIANVDSSQPSYYEIPTIAFTQKRTRGTFYCRSISCGIPAGESYCTATYGQGTSYAPPDIVRNGGLCSTNQRCGSCFVQEYLDCFVVVLQKQPTGVPTIYSSPTRNNLLSCQAFSSTLNYRAVTNTSQPISISAVVILNSDPFYNAYRFSSSRTSSPFYMVDEKANSDAADEDAANAKKKLLIPGILMLIISISLMVFGLVGLTCGRECCFCIFGQAIIEPTQEGCIAPQRVVSAPVTTTVTYVAPSSTTVAVMAPGGGRPPAPLTYGYHPQQTQQLQQQTIGGYPQQPATYVPPQPPQPYSPHQQVAPYGGNQYNHPQQMQAGQRMPVQQQHQQGYLHAPPRPMVVEQQQHYTPNGPYGYTNTSNNNNGIEMQQRPPYEPSLAHHYQPQPSQPPQQPYGNGAYVNNAAAAAPGVPIEFTNNPGKTL